VWPVEKGPAGLDAKRAAFKARDVLNRGPGKPLRWFRVLDDAKPQPFRGMCQNRVGLWLMFRVISWIFLLRPKQTIHETTRNNPNKTEVLRVLTQSLKVGENEMKDS
jgi:hypothetical protein